MAINKNKLMDAARKARDKGQVDKAIKEYLKIVREDPKDVRVWLKIGDLYAKKGAKNEATETYLKVAKFYGEQGFYLKAVAVYKQILKLDPRLVEVNLKLAELYRQLGLMSDAMQHFEMVAAFFHREGKTKEALATIRQLVDLDPENVATRIKLAELYSKEGMTDAAVTEFGHACDYLKKHKREDDYIKVAERLLWHKPDRIELNRELATLYLRRSDPRRALQKLQACFKADPRHIDTLGMLAQAFQALDQKGKTVSVLKEMARILMDTGKRRDAEEVHRKILSFVPNDPDSKAFLGDKAAESAPRPVTPVAPAVVEQVMEPAPRRTAAISVPKNPTGSMPIVDPVALGLLDDDPEPDPAASSELARRGFPPRGPAYRLASEGHDLETNALVAELELENEAFDQDSSVRGEAHADEIVKILTETDVYVKYGLHQKAIDHLRKVFDLDPHNLEARERLKDILVTQGRAAEAVQELLRMAEQMGPIEPERAEVYLREMIRIAPDDGRAAELAGRYRLDLTGADEMDIAVGDESARRAAGSGARPVRDDLDFDDLDLESSSGRELPATREEERPVRAPSTRFEDDGFEFELGDDDDSEDVSAFPAAEVGGAGDGTMEVLLDQVEDAMAVQELDPDELEAVDDDLDFPAEVSGDPNAQTFVPTVLPPSADDLDEDLPFDPDDARAFDADAGLDPQFADASGLADKLEPQRFDDRGSMGFDDDLPPVPMPRAYSSYGEDPMPPTVEEPGGHDGHDDGMPDIPSVTTSDHEFLSTAAQTPLHRPQIASEATLHTVQTGAPTGETLETPLEDDDEDGPPTGEGGSLEDDLDEADFFITQALWEEARDILEMLLGRHPGHPLVLAKLRDVEAMASGQDPASLDPPLEDELPPITPLPVEPPRRDGSVPGSTRPVVMLEKPLEDSDADTHYDLGQAYKEMGLWDEAIKAFNKVLGVSGREVQCHLMIGLCHKEQGNLSEAINQFKAGLYVDKISLGEKFGLYYEIGNCYEDLDDPQEALYYYEMVLKKDPDYRDIRARVSRIRASQGGNGNGSGGGGGPKRQGTLDADTDSALNDLKR